jgi:hypothetical protein
MGDMFKGVGGPIQALKRQLERNIKDTDRARRRGRISDKQTLAQANSINAALERVNKTAEELAEGNITGAKAAKIMAKEIARANKVLKEENKYTRARLKNERALAQSMKLQLKRAGESARFELKASRINTGKSKIVKGAGGVMQGLASKLPGSGGIGPSGVGGGALEKLSSAGPWGMITGALAKVGTALLGAQRDAVISATRRIISYGTETGSIDSDVQKWHDSFVAASGAATDYRLDLEAVKSATIEIATQTGTTAGEMAKVIPEIARMAFVSGRGIEDLSQQITARINQTGKSATEVTEELVYTTEMAFALRKTLGGKVQLDVNDFSREVQELSDNMNALNVDQRSLAKRFAAGLVIANKLGLSYTRGAKAAKELAMAMTANYDQSFATLEVEEDLAALAASKDIERAGPAKEIQEMLRTGFITQDKAAKMLKDIGLDTSAEMFDARMARVTQAMARGEPLAMIEARTGELSPDAVAMLRKVTKIQQETGLDFKDAVGRLSPEEQKKMREEQKELAKRQVDPMTAIQAMTDKILFALSSTIPDLLTRVVDTVDAIGKLLIMFKDPGAVLGDSLKGLTDFFTSDESKAIAKGKASLASKIGLQLGAEKAGGKSSEELIEMLGKDQGLLNKLQRLDEDEKAAVIDVLDEKTSKKIIESVEKAQEERKAKRARDAAAAPPQRVNGVKMNNLKTGADGKARGSAEVTTVPVEVDGMGQAQERAAMNANARKQESGPNVVGP